MKKLMLLALGTVFVAISSLHTTDAVGGGCGINIHNIQKSFNALACTVTITWDTDASTTTNLVRWGTSGCVSPSYPYTEYDGSGYSHSVVIDVTSAESPKINFQIESGDACGTETTGCLVSVSGPCISE